MAKKGAQCGRCDALQAALDREQDLTERILTEFAYAEFADVEAVHAKALSILQTLRSVALNGERQSVPRRRPGPRVRSPMAIAGLISGVIRGKNLTYAEVTQDYLAGLLGYNRRTLVAKLNAYFDVSGLDWDTFRVLLVRESQIDSPGPQAD